MMCTAEQGFSGSQAIGVRGYCGAVWFAQYAISCRGVIADAEEPFASGEMAARLRTSRALIGCK